MKKISKVLLVSIFMVILMASTAFAATVDGAAVAEEKEIIIHVKNQFEWPNLNIYNWGDAKEIFSAWPGTEVTEKPDENGWITLTVKASAKLNLVFSTDFNEDGMFDKVNDKQTSDIKDIPNDIGECWVIISAEEAGTEGELNPYEVDAAAKGYLYSIPKDTWPVSDGFVAPSEEKYTKEDVEFEPTAAPETEKPAVDKASDKTATSSTAATGEKTSGAVIFGLSAFALAGIALAVVVVIVIIVVIVKKKND